MKLVIRNLQTGYYFRRYSEKIEKLNDWTKDLCDATVINEEPGFDLIKKLRSDGYKISFIAIKDMAKYERLTKLQREVKTAVKLAIRQRREIAEMVDKKFQPSTVEK